MPTVAELVAWGTNTLARHGVPDARRNCEFLLARALGRDRTWVYTHPQAPVDTRTVGLLRRWVRRRQQREPLWYIVGEEEFYGLAFHVDPRVLIPRPETEMLVDAGLVYLERHPQALVADICTGSGCVAVAVAVRAPASPILATDIAPGALEVAAANAHRHQVADRITFLQGDLWQPLPPQVDLVLANPPYVRLPDFPELMPEVRDYEPTLALAAGPDGLDVIRRLLAEAPRRLAPGGALYMEIGEEQGPAVRELAQAAFPAAQVDIRRDLARLDRMLALELP